jgi:cell volume regulation protein A
VQVRADTVLHSGDEVVVLIDPDSERDPTPIFTGPASGLD